MWWILSDVGTAAKHWASHSRLRSHKGVTLPDAAQCSWIGSLAFWMESIARCMRHSDTDERLALTSPQEGSPWWLQSSFQLCKTLQLCFPETKSKQLAKLSAKQRRLIPWRQGLVAFWNTHHLPILAYLWWSQVVVPAPEDLEAGPFWYALSSWDSCRQSSSIYSPETKIYDRQKTFFPNHRVTSHRNENIRRVRIKHHPRGRWICRPCSLWPRWRLWWDLLARDKDNLHSKQARASLLKFTFSASAMHTYPSDGLFHIFYI